MKKWTSASCCVIVVCCIGGLHAGEESSTERPYREYSPKRAYFLDLAPPRGSQPARGIVYDATTLQRLYPVSWYAPSAAIADDGEHLVRLGNDLRLDDDAPQGEAAITFYRKKELLARYLIGDLCGDKTFKVGTTREEKKYRHWLAKIDGFEGATVFKITLVDGATCTFDVQTGRLLKRTEMGAPPVPKVSARTPGRSLVEEAAPLAESLQGLSIALYGHLREQLKGKNLVVSPHSLGLGLSLALAGARGETAEELCHTLDIKQAFDGPEALLKAWQQLDGQLGGTPIGLGAMPMAVREIVGKGLEVTGVPERSPLSQDLPAGWVIKRINGTNVTTVKELRAALWAAGRSLVISAVSPSGETRDIKLRQPLPFPIVDVAARFWLAPSLKLPPELDKSGGTLQEAVRRIDFASPTAAVAEINKEVARSTRGRVKELLRREDIQPTMQLVLTSTLYLAADWRTPFPVKNTKDMAFNVSPDRKIMLPTMTGLVRAPYWENKDGRSFLELPYRGNRLGMIVVLPSKEEGLEKLEAKLTPELLREWLTQAATAPEHTVEVSLPQLVSRTRFDAANVLKKLGMKTPFDPSAADFSGFHARKGTVLSGAWQETELRIDEEGTEASAGTAIAAASIGVVSDVKRFRADRPFLFIVRDWSTQAVLFMGRVIEPQRKPSPD
jgi:serine protease inhibitor